MATRKSSRVNRKYKTKHKIRNWREYERGLRSRGDVRIWLSEEAIAAVVAQFDSSIWIAGNDPVENQGNEPDDDEAPAEKPRCLVREVKDELSQSLEEEDRSP